MFEKNLKNFGIILKGASVLRLDEVAHHFQDCYIVNNIDRNKNNSDSEYSLIAPLIRRKNIVHFVNRLKTATLLHEHYSELEIRHIQFSKAEFDSRLIEMKKIYEKMNLVCHLLPQESFRHNDFFNDKFYLKKGDSNYKNKHPNTGVLSIIHVLVNLRPKTLWIIGLDFYDRDYLYRRPWHNSLKKQQEKMKNTDMKNHFLDVVRRYPETQVKLITASSFSQIPKNLELL